MIRHEIELLKAPLSGTNLIEANAGTGKTYNITALFTRMLTEPQYPVESILVVTYTNAAVSDLKAKIYRRLQDVLGAMTALRDGRELKQEDTFHADYAKQRSDFLDADIRRIKDAIRDFDRCSIFTIHSFCQRMLKENAFSGRVAYDVELTGDSTELIRKPVYNFWRTHAYKAHKAVIPYLTKTGPDSLISFYRQVQSNQSMEVLKPEKRVTEADIINAENELKECFMAVCGCYHENTAEVQELMNTSRSDFPLDKRSYQQRYVDESFRTLEELIAKGEHRCPTDTKKMQRFTNEAISEKSKKGTVTHTFFDLVSIWYEKELALQNLAELFAANFRFNLCEYMDEVLERYKQQKNLQSYDDLIARMRSAVIENSGHSSMTASLHHKFKAALIDEFQDTDPYQYDIFHTVFGRQNKPFFMIGDPKQAIYSFRGADVFAYLKAAQKGGQQYTLLKNFRSDPALVEAVNEFFKGEKAFMLENIEYNPSFGTDREYKLTVNGKAHPPVTLWEAEKPKTETVALATAKHIATLLNTASAGNAQIAGRQVRPSDIAVICRTRSEMNIVKEALSACRVPAVVSGSESVFRSEEALETADILAAVIQPFSQRRVKTALATSVFGYGAHQIYDIAEGDEWDAVTEEFRTYNDIINIKGYAPMFFAMAANRKINRRLAAMPAGERKLTNLIHLTELIQRFEAEKKAAPADILKWLKDKINNADMRDDEAELKMDSDDNAVTIITIHKSKGLEYNIVYTPFLMFHKEGGKDKFPKYHSEDRFIMDISKSDEAKALSESEELAEGIRLAYVALTRAKSACFTAWGDARGHEKSPLARLINGEHGKFDSAVTHSFFAGSKVAIAPMPDDIVQIYTERTKLPDGANRTFAGAIPAIWRINSFSGLIHSSSGAKDTDQFARKQESADSADIFDIFSFPKGAKAGTCLHECMEDTKFEDFSKWSVLENVQAKLEAYSFDADFAPAVADNLYTIINKDMGGVKLADLKEGAYVAEMEFQMHTLKFSSAAVADIFEKGGMEDYAKAASTLGFEAVQGFMNGFADLIFESGGRYYVLDWKSNHLGMEKQAYSYDRMHEEMLASHYYMQMHIYTLALHLHLSKMLPDYDYDKHIGGGIYVFMRGVNTAGDEGIYLHRPSREIILQMQELMIK